MRRDDDYLRDMLRAMEASDDWLHLVGYEEDQVAADKSLFHAKLLCDEGFLEEVRPCSEYRMTNKGHDFVATTRDDKIWGKTKAALSKLGGHSVTMLFQVAEGYARAKLRDITGLDI